MSGDASSAKRLPSDGPDFVTRISRFAHERRDQWLPLGLLLLLSGALVWAYWNSLCLTASRWNDPLYSHGYMVPAFALVLMWLRRQRLELASPLDRWLGLALLGAGLGLRIVFTRYAVITAELVTFVPCLAGVFLLVGGRSLIRWAGPSVAFLLFMFPQPTFIKDHVLQNLQSIATVLSTFTLQTLGVAAFSEGNRITVGELQLGVEDACSGLRMATNLMALVVAMLLISKRPWWDQVIILLSAVPIAIIVNVMRITATALFMLAVGGEAINKTFHDWAGFAMMPLALGLLFIEIALLSRLVVEEEHSAEVAVAGMGLRSSAARRRPAKPAAS